MNRSALLVLLAFTAFLLLPSGFGAPTGANVSVGESERANGTTPGTLAVGGGNLTSVNLSSSQISERWAGFYGFISAGLKLADASNNAFFEWTVGNISNSVVYVANGTVEDFASLTHGNQSTSPSYLGDAAVDNFNNTFRSYADFTTNTISLTAVNYTTTWQEGSQGTLRTYALADVANAIHVWAGVAEQNVSGFKGATNYTDYQILAPADSSGVTYYFYLEIP